MLETSYFVCIDQASPFLDAIVVFFCGNENRGPITKVWIL